MALAALAVLPFAVTWWGDFVYDDVRIVAHDPRVIDPARWHELWTSDHWRQARGNNLSNWRPLTATTYALNRFALGAEPWSHHVINTVLHGGVVLALHRLARPMVGPWPSVAAAALFAVAPIHAEAVANVVGRAELMAALFALLAWGAHRRGRAAAAAVWFALAILSKETALPLLAVLVLDDLLGRPGSEVRPEWRAAPWIGLGAVTGLYLAARWAVLGSIAGNRGLETLWVMNPLLGDDVTLSVRWATAIRMLGLQWWLLVWPARLSADHSWRQVIPSGSWLEPGVLGAVLALGALAAVAVAHRQRNPALTLGIGAWFFFASITSNLVILVGVIFAERLVYLPSAGMCLAAGAAIGTVRRVPPRGIALGLAAVLAAMAVRSGHRAWVWGDELRLWQRERRISPMSAQVWSALGIQLAHAGEIEQSLQALRRAIDLSRPLAGGDPRHPDAVRALARVLMREADAALQRGERVRAEELWSEADAALTECVRLGFDDSEMRSYLAIRLRMQGRPEEARRAFEASVAMEEPDLVALLNFADWHRREGRLEEAATALERALAQHPGAGAAAEMLAAVQRAMETEGP